MGIPEPVLKMQLLLAFALLFLASAQPGFIQTLFWDDCNCNGTVYYTEATPTDDLETECEATAADECDSCNEAVAKRRGINPFSDEGLGESIRCLESAASLNEAGSNTYSGYIVYNNSDCDGGITYWEEYLIGECFYGSPSYQSYCDNDGSGWEVEFEGDECAEGEEEAQNWNYTQECMEDGSSWYKSTCQVITEAPTDAPTEATEAPTEGSTAAPTSGSSPVTIFDFKNVCKVTLARETIEAAFTLAVSTGTGVTAECTISNCDATEAYDGAQFKYSCKAVDGAEFDDTTAGQICPIIATTIETSLSLASGVTQCVDEELSGNPTGTKGLVTIIPLEAAGSYLTTSMFMLVVLILANLF